MRINFVSMVGLIVVAGLGGAAIHNLMENVVQLSHDQAFIISIIFSFILGVFWPWPVFENQD